MDKFRIYMIIFDLKGFYIKYMSNMGTVKVSASRGHCCVL